MGDNGGLDVLALAEMEEADEIMKKTDTESLSYHVIGLGS